MKITKRLSLILVLSLVFSCFGAFGVFAGSDGTIHIEPENISVKQGESVVVDLVSDTDLTGSVTSALEWAFDIGSFYVEPEGDSDFYVAVNHTIGSIRMAALEGSVEIKAGVPFASLRFTALDDARTITRNSNNIKCNIKTETYDVMDVTADDILITITADTPPDSGVCYRARPHSGADGRTHSGSHKQTVKRQHNADSHGNAYGDGCSHSNSCPGGNSDPCAHCNTCDSGFRRPARNPLGI